MYKTIISIISIIFIFNTCSKTSSFDKAIVIKYYTDFNEVYMRSIYEEKHTFSKPISNDKAQERIKHFLVSINEPIIEVYYKNEEMFKNGIPIKAKKYDGPRGYMLWSYDKKGRLNKFKHISQTDNSITEYQYFLNEKIKTTIKHIPTRLSPYKKLTNHYFYDNKHHLIKILTYYDDNLISISRPDKKNKNMIYEYDLKNKIIDSWDITIRKSE